MSAATTSTARMLLSAEVASVNRVAKKNAMIPTSRTSGRSAATHSVRPSGRRKRRLDRADRGSGVGALTVGGHAGSVPRRRRALQGQNGGVADHEHKSPLDRAMRFLPVDAVIRQVDVQDVINRIDINELLERVDIDQMLDRIDLDKLMERIDVNRIVQRVDIEEIVGRVDIDQLVGRTEIGGIIVQSTGGIATHALDFVRSQGVGLDEWINRWIDRILRRKPGVAPDGPPLLVRAAVVPAEEAS